VQSIFQGLRDPYEQLYYTGLLHERHAKTSSWSATPRTLFLPLVEEAMRCFAQAEKIRPAGMTTVFSAGIVASDCWKAVSTSFRARTRSF